jgi:hypothetical protein
MSDPQASRNDPTPEERIGDSSIKPVVIGFIVTIVVILVAAIIFVKSRQSKAIPVPHDAHQTSQIMRLPLQPPQQLAA